MQRFLLFSIIILFFSSITIGQGSKSIIEDSTKTLNSVSSVQAEEGDVIISDGTNVLLRIIDEGNFGAIELKDGIPSATTNKLYNNGGTLHFNGSSLSSGGASSINDLSDGKTTTTNVFLGLSSGTNIGATADYNSTVGVSSLNSNTSGSYNTAIGYQSLYSNTSGGENTAIGSEALKDNINGNGNIAIGETAIINNIDGNYNTAIGRSSLATVQSGSNNTALGYRAGLNALGDGNVFLGNQAGFYETGSNKLYINNSESVNPLIYGNFADDSVKINGFGHVTKALSVGEDANSSSLNSAAFGKNVDILGVTSFTAGEDNAVFAYNSSSLGLGLKVSSYLSTVIGRFNENDILYDNDNWIATEPLFVIGNGTDDANRSNALTVLKNGNTFINGNLSINGKAAIGETANASGTNSFAIGSNINASGNGTIFLGDNSAASVQNASNDNRFAARFDGGYRFYTTSDLSVGARMNNGDNGWTSISDSTKKTNFKSVNGEEILDKISDFHLTSWNYKTQDPAKHRHYGPMAQDFFKAFGNDGIGTIGTDTTISSTDFDGINLIAIQALEKRTKIQDERIRKLEYRIRELENQNTKLVSKNFEYLERNQKLNSDIAQIKQVIYQLKSNQSNIEYTLEQ